jgi:tight adherence protein B
MNIDLKVMAFGLLVVAFSFSAILILRGLFALRKRNGRLDKLSSDPSFGEITLPETPGTGPGPVARMDRSFENMIRGTALDVTPEQALALIALVGTLLAAALFFWRGEIWLTALGLVVGSLGTLGIFVYMRHRQRVLLQEQLPDTLFLLARSLRAGLTLQQAITLTGEQGVRPLADEFRLVATQLQLGLTVPAALQVMAARLKSVDFDAFVSTVSLYHHTGGNLAELLDRLAASARDHNQFRQHFLAATALGRATAVFIGVAGPVLLLSYAIFQPAFSQAFFSSTLGILTFVIVLALECIGALWLYRLLSVDY